MMDLMQAPYLDGGRTLQGIDCWGVVLEVRRRMGLPELPSIGGTVRSDVKEATRFYQSISAGLAIGPPRPGAIAAVLRGGLFVHAGVVIEADGRTWVMDTNPGNLPTMHPIADFLATYFKVTFYHDIDLSE